MTTLLHFAAAWLWEQRAEGKRDNTRWVRRLLREGGWVS